MNRRPLFVIFMIGLLLLITACGQPKTDPTQKPPAKTWNTPPEMLLEPDTVYDADVDTTQGMFTIELYAKTAPKTVNNFIFLARENFYNDVVFHRIIKDFMIQTGDPTGTGSGGPGYKFEDELKTPYVYNEGTVAMANSGPNTNGSQFFICTGKDCQNLNDNPNYTIFGKVKMGMNVVHKIAETPVKASARGELSVPTETVKINSIKIYSKIVRDPSQQR